MKIFNREDWIENGCVPTMDTWCNACPYVVYDMNGTRKCDKKMKEKCESGELYEDPWEDED